MQLPREGFDATGQIHGIADDAVLDAVVRTYQARDDAAAVDADADFQARHALLQQKLVQPFEPVHDAQDSADGTLRMVRVRLQSVEQSHDAITALTVI